VTAALNLIGEGKKLSSKIEKKARLQRHVGGGKQQPSKGYSEGAENCSRSCE
jgi:hypothetical protein